MKIIYPQIKSVIRFRNKSVDRYPAETDPTTVTITTVSHITWLP